MSKMINLLEKCEKDINIIKDKKSDYYEDLSWVIKKNSELQGRRDRFVQSLKDGIAVYGSRTDAFRMDDTLSKDESMIIDLVERIYSKTKSIKKIKEDALSKIDTLSRNIKSLNAMIAEKKNKSQTSARTAKIQNCEDFVSKAQSVISSAKLVLR